MTTEWSLDELYKGFDDPAYGKDVAELTAQIDALTTLLADAGRMQEKERTEKVLAAQSGIAQLFYQLSLYVELRQSVNTEDGTVMAENAKLMKLQAKMAPLEAAAGKLLAGIREDANWLLNMVENLLSVTRIQDDQGISSVNKTDESLEEVISEAVQRFHKRFPDISVKVSVPDAFIMVPMDAMLIEQVINNLLENAHFHSGSEKPIELKVRTEKESLYITIKDYGKGIDPKRLPTLFDGGGVNTNESGDSHKGMGIGLSICKTIINAHGGTIQAANHADGAMFTFTLPDWKEY